MGEAATVHRALVAGITTGALAVAGILGGTGWGLAAATTADGLRIEYGVQPVTCDGARVGSVELDASSAPGLRGAIVELTPGMLCRIHVQLVNDGWADAAVQTVALPFMAEDAGFGLEPYLVNPNGMRRLEPGAGDPSTDAVFALHDVVAAAGSTTTLEVLFEWADVGRIGEGARIGLPAPAITVSALGREWQVESAVSDMISYTLPREAYDESIRFS